jgi:hypothetical protein
MESGINDAGYNFGVRQPSAAFVIPSEARDLSDGLQYVNLGQFITVGVCLREDLSVG